MLCAYIFVPALVVVVLIAIYFSSQLYVLRARVKALESDIEWLIYEHNLHTHRGVVKPNGAWPTWTEEELERKREQSHEPSKK